MMRSSGRPVLRDFERGTSTSADKNCARLVFNVFSAGLGRRGVDQNLFEADQTAFDVAVRTYSKRNPDVPENDARRAVANIICCSL
jgi:hypothetical protein